MSGLAVKLFVKRRTRLMTRRREAPTSEGGLEGVRFTRKANECIAAWMIAAGGRRPDEWKTPRKTAKCRKATAAVPVSSGVPFIRLGRGRSRRLHHPERQLHGADADDVPIAERSRALHSLIPNEG